ncbi:MAG: HupE/UreJ family protein [Pseudomonadota bacterium]
MKVLRVFCGLLFAAGLLVSASGIAHEVRPAYLEIRQTAPSTFDVLWKQPLLGDLRLPIDPVFPADCTTLDGGLPEHTGTALVQRWQVQCDLRTGNLQIAGLTRTLTDVMVRIIYADGDSRSALLRADDPSLDLGDPAPSVATYLLLGFEHLLFGIDHLLFVIGLVLLIGKPWMLVKTITAFTVAHSITLGLSVLELVSLPQRPVEAVIALSILFLARELMVEESRRSAIMQLRPWLIAFAFGLLHGFGFASALTDIGLPRDQMALSLLLFNLGIELGQLAVIGVWLAVGWLLHQLPGERSPVWRAAFTIAMGTMAGYWTFDRMVLIL